MRLSRRLKHYYQQESTLKCSECSKFAIYPLQVRHFLRIIWNVTILKIQRLFEMHFVLCRGGKPGALESHLLKKPGSLIMACNYWIFLNVHLIIGEVSTGHLVMQAAGSEAVVQDNKRGKKYQQIIGLLPESFKHVQREGMANNDCELCDGNDE